MIAEGGDYRKHLNQYPVVHITFNDLSKKCVSYDQYMERIERRLIKDLRREYPETEIDEDAAVWDIFLELFAERHSEKSIFVLDEWDFIFHQQFVSETDKKDYVAFLRNLLKDRPYVRLAYMTGILPIEKYASGSEFNMFAEYTMATEEKFTKYFEFTDKEVDVLFERYQEDTAGSQKITRDGLRNWYG